ERFVMDGAWSLHIYRWTGALSFGGRTFPVRPGFASIEPPDTELLWRYDDPECAHGYAHFTLPRSRSGSELVSVPVAQDLGAAFRRRIGVSHNHLTRLFQRHLGCGVAAFVRNRRVARAQALLQGTELPMRAIVAEVGVSDLQAFNKLIRRGTGLSPRAVRALS